MTNIRFRDQEIENEKGGKDNPQPVGQNGVSAEQLQQLIEALGSNDASKGSSNSTPPAQDNSTHNLLGISESQVSKLKDKLGDDVAEVLIGTLMSIKQGSENTDALLLSEVNKIAEGLSGKLDEQSKTLETLGNSRAHDASAILGLDRVFNEDNKEDLGEMLDIITKNSAGMFDAKKAFNEAAEKNDFEALAGFKEKFEDFTQYKYKDHQSVPGGNTANNRTALEKRNTVETEIADLEKQVEKAMSGPNKDYNKVAELQEKILEKAEALI